MTTSVVAKTTTDGAEESAVVPKQLKRSYEMPFAAPVLLRRCIRPRSQLRGVPGTDVLSVLKRFVHPRRARTAACTPGAAVMAAQDDVPHLEHLQGELEGEGTMEAGSREDNGTMRRTNISPGSNPLI